MLLVDASSLIFAFSSACRPSNLFFRIFCFIEFSGFKSTPSGAVHLLGSGRCLLLIHLGWRFDGYIGLK